jgi:protein tyrosine/serine phosphatase
MNFARTHFRNLFASLFAVIIFSAASAAQTQTAPQQTQTRDFSHIKIKNFGQMDQRFFRGAEPKKLEDFRALKELGIDTVIDLQAEAEPREKEWVESLGMRYVNIPMVAKKYPTPESVAAFLKLVDDPSTGEFYLHCAGGRHRTGALGAVYRYKKYGWDYEQAYAEMKKFDFYTRWGHGSFKEFVQDYYKDLQAAQGQPATHAEASAASGTK